ncbi:hypothetical protein [Nocardia puris]|uniref:Uncharacterized protein n=1 Tax=Nocardia puris TaxID=208602 RepID=A0A366DBW0_9NOCA|nr:hypothetical protein [Nocardia puris]RBO87552.1 hypothetical protein DFR74_111259 [Nocardia puris]
MLIAAICDVLVRVAWMPVAAFITVSVPYLYLRNVIAERRNHMHDNTFTPVRGWLSVYDDAANRRRQLTSVLREENERLHPYGPPPRGVDEDRWAELTESVEISAAMVGHRLEAWQVRTMAAAIADRVLVDTAQLAAVTR